MADLKTASHARPTNYAVAAGVAALSAALVWALRAHRPFDLGDEGYRFVLAQAWARGSGLYAHFVPLYPPGEHVFSGWWLAAFGETLPSLRASLSLLTGIAVGLWFHVVEARRDATTAGLLALAVTLVVPPSPKILASAIVFVVALHLVQRPELSARAALGLGALAGTLLVWREDSAVLLIAATGLAIALGRRSHVLAGWWLIGAGLGMLPWLVALGLRAEIKELIAHLGQRLTFLVVRLADPTDVTWRFDLVDLPKDPRALGNRLVPYLAALPPLLYLGLLWREWRRARRGQPVDRVSVAAAVVGLAYLPQFLWERRDFSHFQTHLPIFLAVGATAWPRRRWERFATIAALLAVTAFGVWAAHRRPLAGPYPTTPAAEAGVTMPSPPWADLPRCPGDTMIALAWGPGWYVVEGLRPGTRHLSWFLRHVGTPPASDEVAADLRAPENRWVVTDPYASEPLTRMVAQQYAPAGRWGRWELWERASARHDCEPPAR